MNEKRNPRARKARLNKLAAGPEPESIVRPDKVARGKKLIQDSDYPPPRVLQAVARVLARNWTSPKGD
jgi:hypothetical protein